MSSSHAAKKMRAHEPNITVITSNGSRFQCYSFQLCFMSPVFDACCSTSTSTTIEMSESNGIIRLDDVEPDHWRLLYKFIDPPIDPTQHTRVNHDNLSILLPLFHRLGMNDRVGLCDKFINDVVLEQTRQYQQNKCRLLGDQCQCR